MSVHLCHFLSVDIQSSSHLRIPELSPRKSAGGCQLMLGVAMVKWMVWSTGVTRWRMCETSYDGSRYVVSSKWVDGWSRHNRGQGRRYVGHRMNRHEVWSPHQSQFSIQLSFRVILCGQILVHKFSNVKASHKSICMTMEIVSKRLQSGTSSRSQGCACIS